MVKKSIVEKDKAKIEQVIAGLDEKKNEALKKAFERVNIVSEEIINLSIFENHLCRKRKNSDLYKNSKDNLRSNRRR